MGLCRLMLFAHIDDTMHEPHEAKHGDGDDSEYSDYNLLEGIQFARSLLQDGFTHFPHDTAVHCRTFIKWAKRKLTFG